MARFLLDLTSAQVQYYDGALGLYLWTTRPNSRLSTRRSNCLVVHVVTSMAMFSGA